MALASHTIGILGCIKLLYYYKFCMFLWKAFFLQLGAVLRKSFFPWTQPLCRFWGMSVLCNKFDGASISFFMRKGASSFEIVYFEKWGNIESSHHSRGQRMFAVKTSRPQEDQVKHLLESFQLHDVTHLPLFFFTGSNESQYVMEEHATRLQQRRAEVTN